MSDRPRPVLEVQDLVAGYRHMPVVRGLNLHVDAGEVVALLGPNGAGKTTTLLTIAGLLPSLEGEVLFQGRSVRRRPADYLARNGLAFLPEDRSLFAQLTVRENLRLVRNSSGLNEIFDLLPALRPLANRRAGLLSGGEQQMLALARAFIGKPRLLMVDELSLGLAPVIVTKLLPLLPQLAQDTGCAVLLVEQHVDFALDTASRAYVMRGGQLILEGSSEQLAKDRSLLAASYLGVSDADIVTT